MFHVSAHLEKLYDGSLEYRSDEGAMVSCVGVWPIEVNVHT